ncbi:type II toxin-antitoxin system RelE/ParE family toxin [Candidatus Roizmanbacteria bacterium]|nr:type II toxin-antitoxin system RelE/ParE family toxin [Candidatus Roizmanbacteria bacterium]
MTKVYYYINQKDESPVKDFIESLPETQRAKVFRIFQVIHEYGIQSIPRHVKKLQGFPLWEIRILGADNIRIIYIMTHGDTLLALHGFIKKTQKTPKREIETAINRYNEWLKTSRPT